jgi:Uma2 family endonuclease
MTVTTLMTADELLRMPDDGYHRYELVRGELRTMSPAGIEHGDVAAAIVVSLGSYVKAKNLGKVYTADPGFWIERNPDTVRAPDVAFIRRERVVKTPRFFEGAPDLAIEVVSPNDTYTEVEEKALQMLEAGTRAVVVVIPKTKGARVYRTGQLEVLTDAIAVDDIVPGWRMPLAEVFD